MVLTLIIDVNESEHYDALQAANSAAREHPCRIVTVIRRTGKSAPRLDAEIRVGQENLLGEVIVLRLYGALRDQAALVRGHAAWALGRLAGTAARAHLEAALKREDDPWVRDECGLARQECGPLVVQ
jgi:HEAT repeat protein